MNKMYKKRIALIFSAVIAVTLILSGCKRIQTPEQPKERTEDVLGTVCSVKIYDHVKDSTLDQAFKRLEEIENKMTINKETSEIIKVNNAAGVDYVKVSDDTFDVIKEGLHFSQLYSKFDITIGPLVKLWNISFDAAANARIPADSEIKALLPFVDYRNVLLDEKGKRVMLKQKGMMMDLGGIAKGYAADEVVKILKKNGVQHAIVNLGGNVMTLGAKPDGTPWKVAVQHPFSERGEYIGIVKVIGKTVVTSGIYERYIEKDGKIYHHILDKATGYPVDNNVLSTTIIADRSVDGDGYAKVLGMGVDEGLKYTESLKGVEAIFITKDNKVYITPGLKDVFELTDNSFQLVQ